MEETFLDLRTNPANRSLDGQVETRKLSRIRRGGELRVMDLFSGCGGISLGFQAAGYSIRCSVESDPDAAASFRKNIMASSEDDGLARDITKFEPSKVFSDWGIDFDDAEDIIDVLVGGPPCQAYSRAGRAKLRSLSGEKDAHVQDPRANLYLRYLHYVRKTKPLVILIENVPDSLRFGGVNIPEEICEALRIEGYRCHYTILNSAHYGVPQLRERMFLMGLHWTCARDPEFPIPTHRFNLPIGYQEFRIGLLRDVVKKINKGEPTKYLPLEEPGQNLPKAISTKQGIGDLPPVNALELSKSGSRSCPSEPVHYRKKRPSSYAQLMKNWHGLSCPEEIGDHIVRWVPRDFPIFRRMQPGDQYPEAHAIACRMLEKKLKQAAKEGPRPRKGMERYEALKKETIPPYPVDKFPNKWRKMEAGLPARTLLAHLGKDCYTHIHYDSSQGRSISIREAARLQSFPDGFKFVGNMGSVFKQIGNAVPPLVAKHLAIKIKDLLGL